jgi:hypothetical protein
MMAKAPAQRFQTPDDVVTALAPFCRPEAENEDAGAPRARNWSPRRKLVLAACLLVVGIALLGGVLMVRTPDGTIVLENLPANAEVLVDGNKVSVKLADGGKRIEVQAAPGKRTLAFKCDGLEFETEEVTLAAGERKPLRVRRVFPPEPPPGPMAKVEPGDAAPDLGNVMPLIDDDFSDPDKSHFPTMHDKSNGLVFSFENRRYVMQQPRIHDSWGTMSPDHAVEGDFACKVVGRETVGDSGWGITFNATFEGSKVLAIRLRDGAVEVGKPVWGQRTFAPIGGPSDRATTSTLS